MSKNLSLFILGVTAITCSRAMFALFNDPEGPNLLIVIVAAVIIYGVSVYVSRSVTDATKRLWIGILIQIVTVMVLFYLGLEF